MRRSYLHAHTRYSWGRKMEEFCCLVTARLCALIRAAALLPQQVLLSGWVCGWLPREHLTASYNCRYTHDNWLNVTIHWLMIFIRCSDVAIKLMCISYLFYHWHTPAPETVSAPPMSSTSKPSNHKMIPHPLFFSLAFVTRDILLCMLMSPYSFPSSPFFTQL